MREKDFYTHIRQQFPVLDPAQRDLAVDIANAMFDATQSSRLNTGAFEFEGMWYMINTHWHDGCISGDCNPATCWTEWELVPAPGLTTP